VREHRARAKAERARANAKTEKIREGFVAKTVVRLERTAARLEMNSGKARETPGCKSGGPSRTGERRPGLRIRTCRPEKKKSPAAIKPRENWARPGKKSGYSGTNTDPFKHARREGKSLFWKMGIRSIRKRRLPMAESRRLSVFRGKESDRLANQFGHRIQTQLVFDVFPVALDGLRADSQP